MSNAQALVRRPPSSSSLKDVLEVILDKGLVIDAFVRVSLVGIELLTIDARIVVASIDSYLRFARAAERIDLRKTTQAAKLSNFLGSDEDNDSMSENIGEGIVDEAVERIMNRKEEGDSDDS